MQFLVTKYQDQIVPKDYLSLVLAKLEKVNKTFGFAVADVDEQGKRRLTVLREDFNASIDELMAMQEAYKQYPLVMQIEEKPAGLLDDQRQPVDMVTDKDDNLVAIGFVVGEYNNLAKKGSSHTPQFTAAVEKIRPKLTSVYDACEGDVDDFADELKSKVLTREMENVGTEVFVVVMVSSEPAHIQGFMKGMVNAHEYDWGFVSDHLGYGIEKAAEPEPKKQEEKSSLLSRLGLAGKDKANGPNPVTGAGDAVVTKPVQTKTETQHPPGGSPIGDDEVEYVQCPVGLTNKKAKNWYKREVGFVPEVPKGQSLNGTRPKVPRKKARALSDINKMVTSGISREAVEAHRANKDVTPHHIPQKMQEEPKRQTPDQPVPVEKPQEHKVPEGISEKEYNAIVKGFLKMPTVLKVFDEVGEEIVAPAAAEGMDKPTVNQLIGLDGGIERWDRMPEKLLRSLNAMAPEQFVHLFMEQRYHRLNVQNAYKELLKKSGKPAEVAEKTPLPTKEQPTAQPAPSPTAAPAAAKSSSLFGGLGQRTRRRA